MRIEVLGMGCQKCANLYEAAKQAAEELGLSPEIVKVEDIQKIMSYGVMTTPALVVDGVVKVAGKVPGKEEIKGYLK